jgi:hypothetical protein
MYILCFSVNVTKTEAEQKVVIPQYVALNSNVQLPLAKNLAIGIDTELVQSSSFSQFSKINLIL